MLLRLRLLHLRLCLDLFALPVTLLCVNLLLLLLTLVYMRVLLGLHRRKRERTLLL